MAEKEQGVKRVYEMPEVSAPQEEVITEYRQKRVVAYCRVSTKQEEQLNSYETQRAAYIDMISKNPDWRLVKIFADKGITGTSVKNRDEFNKMIKVNNGERKKYYVENNHPAIVDAATFAKVQEEIARRAGKKKIKQVGTKTELGKYCGKYALTERLLCGECKTPK